MKSWNKQRGAAKWENEDGICLALILNGLSNALVYDFHWYETVKSLWGSLELRYMEFTTFNVYIVCKVLILRFWI